MIDAAARATVAILNRESLAHENAGRYDAGYKVARVMMSILEAYGAPVKVTPGEHPEIWYSAGNALAFERWCADNEIDLLDGIVEPRP